ncbi:haloacid dehalogenase-like hydrolase, putative [Plasmodium vivax]|uniref:Haloacid dehalogenase-like hydrolase, putative n=6 Tax=Plasmodium vivax TaxID=5855 RepID=A5K4J7_PLAVS|nr:haloacid dehalogenase-like hydrolase, putative [Plasmodium vivax]KMZ80429.1 haloacid dehalogenase-like hydrolase [Plasmodium vivax India VII]KMZ84061.1 haloacid dehalogenase-like hydrolase [Plasmodium vivax Brazil I]KMZ93224.1 haloacid dehalogenase-like hydrolase [Plasmodium vivax Mauritania I]KMZ99717.1 haloacid dehalogenase-like hydrolase [Plasmodium vivax North Korean]EDL45575.1 haloacid dehalogenase-like hydrolase, putative [Plasmodium vivax]|eukprot:XP_001615302.1 haloacid dehalogenase-like hydrolase [Plasmodium vivax Sal-1]
MEGKKCFYITEKGKKQNFRNIKLITFDLDHTIWNIDGLLNYADKECYEYMKKNYRRLYDYLQEEYQLSITNLVKQLLENKIEDNNDGVQTLTNMRIDALKFLAKKTNYDEGKFVSEIQELWKEKKNDVHLFISPGTLEYLRELKRRGYTLGAITNGDSDVNGIKFLNEIFTFVIRSMDYNHSKPSVEIFNIAENILKKKNFHFEIHQWMHVGDDVYTDIMGAKNKNINCAWITMFRDGSEVPPNDWYPYLKLKLEENGDSHLSQYDPFADGLFSRFRRRDVVLPYEYIDIEIRHCRDLDAILA